MRSEDWALMMRFSSLIKNGHQRTCSQSLPAGTEERPCENTAIFNPRRDALPDNDPDDTLILNFQSAVQATQTMIFCHGSPRQVIQYAFIIKIIEAPLTLLYLL